MSLFSKATKKKAKLRMSLHGPSGSGKTFSALSIAKHLGQRIAVIDTEHGSASKYSDQFEFDEVSVTGNYHPDVLMKYINGAAAEGYDVIIIDSITHFWNASGGMLQLVDDEAKKAQQRGGKFDAFGSGWKAVTPIYNRVVQTILGCSAHVIVTARAKTEYENNNGKIKKLGLSPEMRNGFEYEMDVEGMLSLEHDLVIGKTRCNALDGKVFGKPGKDIAEILNAWLDAGEEVAPPPPPVDHHAEFMATIEAIEDQEAFRLAVERYKTEKTKHSPAQVLEQMNALKRKSEALKNNAAAE